jgi:membrane protein required for colicin V production
MLIDLVFAVIMILACIKGFRTGFIIAFFSIIAFIVGLAAALKLSSIVAVRLSENVDVSARWLPVISFVVVFLVVVILINVGAKLLQRSFEFALLGWVNKIGGIILFVLLYGIIYSIILFYLVQLHLVKVETIQDSQAYPYIQPLGPAVMNKLGDIIPVFRDMFGQLQDFFSRVGNKL